MIETCSDPILIDRVLRRTPSSSCLIEQPQMPSRKAEQLSDNHMSRRSMERNSCNLRHMTPPPQSRHRDKKLKWDSTTVRQQRSDKVAANAAS